MRDGDPRSELDEFTQSLVAKLRGEIEFAIVCLMASNFDMARAQIDILRQRSIRRLKTIDFEHETWMSQVPGELPEEQVLKITRIVIAALEDTCNSVREIIDDNERDAFGGSDDGSSVSE